MDNNLAGIYIDAETGERTEFTKDDKPIILTEKDRHKQAELRDKQKKALQKENKVFFMKDYNKEISGSFIFMIYRYCKSKKDLTQADLTRLIYLASFVTYEGILTFDNRTVLTKQNLNQLVLKLHKETFYTFYNKIVKLKIIEEKEDKLYLNKAHFFKGFPAEHKKFILKRNYIRIYIDAIQHLYKNTPVKNHKQLGIIFMLIPFINRYWNILCTNPDEQNLELLNILTLDNLAAILGYNKKYLFQLKKELKKIKLADGKNVLIFIEKDIDSNKKEICINPKIIYGDSEPEYAFKVMEKYF
ncbi:hypothetical protein [Pseudobacteroides cellulosolvens]|uniref:Uncharacterized protein n=1 Tax=Pseudobacteroides cellulosolvens ATCC 35603 = DSM 2933 TaxID=398512 RepID=A0A0L6JLS1_9FIRM|nr:hypothetical protein [Pseudobacteroides cellulosolvens]KNY26347.1 hypothetical protein Bccel_1609 [Pseudobacteroides cellulosolvens ATCC 35603 = DSM 2933]